MKNFVEIINKNKKNVGIVGCAVAVIGTFFSFVSISAANVSSTYISTSNGKIVAIALIASAILIYFRSGKNDFLSPLSCATVLTIWDGISSVSDGSGYGVSLSLGFFIMIIGFVIAISSQFVQYINIKEKPKQNVQNPNQNPNTQYAFSQNSSYFSPNQQAAQTMPNQVVNNTNQYNNMNQNSNYFNQNQQFGQMMPNQSINQNMNQNMMPNQSMNQNNNYSNFNQNINQPNNHS